MWPVTLGIGCPLASILFYVQLVTDSARGGRGLLRAVQGYAQFGVAPAASAAIFALLVLVADAITGYILNGGLSSDSFAAAFDKTGLSNSTANAVKGPALAVFSVFGVIPIGLGFAFENVMRAATIYLLVAVIPITSAGLLSGNNRSWFWKTANWAMAAIAVKPVMALALWVGVAITGSGSGLAQLITGLALMFVSLWAPLALFKLFAFTSTTATDAFKSGWSEAGFPNTQDIGGSGASSSPDSAKSTMESSTEARYSSASEDDTACSTATTSISTSGDDNDGNAVDDPTAVSHHNEDGRGPDQGSDGGAPSIPGRGPSRPTPEASGGAGAGGIEASGGASAGEAAAAAV